MTRRAINCETRLCQVCKQQTLFLLLSSLPLFHPSSTSATPLFLLVRRLARWADTEAFWEEEADEAYVSGTDRDAAQLCKKAQFGRFVPSVVFYEGMPLF
ncbi:hypothetical protein V8C26DRAFT_406939 [Trichoderma gracile]